MASSSGSDPDESIKLVLLGVTGVGKSSLALRFVTDDFRPYMESTIGASFMSKTMELHDEENDKKKKRTVAFQIWDTAGQEKYHSLAPMYYRGAMAAIMVYDMTVLSSFDAMKLWVNELKANGPPNIVLAVCANKDDLADHRRVDVQQAQDYADSIGAFYIETSARDDVNVNKLFEEVARRVPSVKDSNSTRAAENGAVDLRYVDSSSSCC